VTPEQYALLAEYVSRSSTVLAHVAERGSRYSRAWVTEYQLWYNTNLSRIQSAFAAYAADQGRTAAEVTRDIERVLGELVVDGRWGDQTAFRTAIFAVSATPPRFASQVAAWWARRGPAYPAKVEEYLARASASNAPDQVPAAPPAEQVPPVVSPDEPVTNVEDARVAASSKPPDAGTDKWNWASILGVVAVLGVGGFLAYQIMQNKSGSKVKRLRAAAA
jgi:hypothetical protein